MAYNGSGVYSLPSERPVQGLVNNASNVLTPLLDLEIAQNAARPVIAGGTGAVTAALARANLEAAGTGATETISGAWTFTGAVTLTAATVNFGAGSIDTASIADDAVTLAKIPDGALTGSDATIVTGTAGTDGNLVQWNADGDAVDGPDVLDEDDMAADSATAVPTQQSVKAYVDAVDDKVPFALVASGILDGTGTPSWASKTGFSASVTDNGSGSYSVAFATAESSTDFAVLLTAPGAASTRMFTAVSAKTTSGFTVNITDINGSPTDVDGINVLVVRVA